MEGVTGRSLWIQVEITNIFEAQYCSSQKAFGASCSKECADKLFQYPLTTVLQDVFAVKQLSIVIVFLISIRLRSFSI
jgi:hypothetical protein